MILKKICLLTLLRSEIAVFKFFIISLYEFNKKK